MDVTNGSFHSKINLAQREANHKISWVLQEKNIKLYSSVEVRMKIKLPLTSFYTHFVLKLKVCITYVPYMHCIIVSYQMLHFVQRKAGWQIRGNPSSEYNNLYIAGKLIVWAFRIAYLPVENCLQEKVLWARKKLVILCKCEKSSVTFCSAPKDSLGYTLNPGVGF